MGGAVDGLRSATTRPVSEPRLNVVWRWRPILAGVVFFVCSALGGVAIALSADIETLTSLRSVLPPGHYLVLFQNNAELRPSGGFIGSFATVDIGKDRIESYVIDTNIYKRDKAFTDKYRIDLPGPMAQGLPNVSWAMRDANWDLDFRDAAQRVAWFYEQEGGEPVDGVIAINASVVQDLLRLTGPLSLGELDVPLTAENFFEVLAQEIEKDYFLDPSQLTANEPKLVLTKLLPVLLDSVRQPMLVARLPRLVRQELDENQIQIYHFDAALEQQIIGHGWAGEIAQEDGDYLHLNNAQIVGLKSSLFVHQEAQLQITTQLDGLLSHQLSVHRTHTGDGLWPDHRNNNYLRVVVPLGSQLIEARVNNELVEAVDITQEAGKSVFGLWLTTDPGHTSSLLLSYVTPSDMVKPYIFRYQKQSGVVSEQLSVTVDGLQLFDGLITKDVVLFGA